MLLLRVALRCGFPTVRHLLAEYGDMTWSELLEFGAYERLDPPIGVRLDYMLSLLCAVVANSRMAGKGAKTYKPVEFLPEWAKPAKKAQTPEQLKEAALQIFGAMPRK